MSKIIINLNKFEASVLSDAINDYQLDMDIFIQAFGTLEQALYNNMQVTLTLDGRDNRIEEPR